MTAATDPAGGPLEPRLPLATWPSFRGTVEQLRGSVPSDRPLDISSLGAHQSTTKQVAAALRALGLVTPSGVADLRLHRLVTKKDYSIVVGAVEQRFPDLVAAISRRASQQEIAQIIQRYGAPTSSNERFWRFVRGAYGAAHQDVPPKITFRRRARASSRAGRVAAVANGGTIPRPPELDGVVRTGDDPVARRLLEAEAAEYAASLDAALARQDLAAAATISERLRLLRAELRRPLGES